MILKRLILAAAVMLGVGAMGVRGQVDPNGGGFQGGAGGFQAGGLQIDPAMMQQIQAMQEMSQTVLQNMQNAGVDPQQFVQEQMQNGGGFDPQAMQQALVDKGIMTPDQMAQMTSVMNNLQQGFQNMANQNPGAIGQMRTNMALNNIRQRLNVTDEEWAVLLPKIERVLTLLADVQQNTNGTMSTGMIAGTGAAGGMAGGANGFGGGQNGFGGAGAGNFAGAAGGGPGAAGVPVMAEAPETPLAKAWRELCEVVQQDQTPEADIKAKLLTWRGLHESARRDLEAARTDLVQILTLRQEGVLLEMGLL